MTQRKKSRGDRNNNPGNIRKSKDKWQGLATQQPDSEFFTFKEAAYGIRAMARLLINYQDDYKLDTISKIINRWAPPTGKVPETGKVYTQNTSGYARQVANAAEKGTNEIVNLHKFDDLFPIVKAMIHHENGYQPYDDTQITKGLVLAGVEPKKKPLVKEKEVQVSAAVGGLTTVSLAAEYINTAAPTFSLLGTIAQYAPYVLGIIVIALIAYLIWKFINDKKKGLR